MEYLVYLFFFCFGWILSKVDSSLLLKNKINKYMEKSFMAGVKYGYIQTMQQVAASDSGHETPVKMGFSIPTTTFNKTDKE